MRARILQRLAGSRLPRNPAAEALAGFRHPPAAAIFPQPLKPAAVLLPVQGDGSDAALLLTRRTEHLHDHPGQISFPGGRVEIGDPSPLATALREAEEEIGLPAEAVEIAGYLPPQAVITGFAIVPVVGFVPAGYVPSLDSFEVAELFSVPLDFLLDPGNRRLQPRQIREHRFQMPEYHYEGHRIWGATAMIIETFVKLIG